MQYKSRIEGGFMLRPLAIEPRWGYSMYSDHMDALSLSPKLSLELYRETKEAAQTTFHNAGKLGSVVQLEFKGVMMAEGGICVSGIDLLCSQIIEAGDNGKVAGIVLNTHSGGGEVFAAQRLSNAIAQVEKIKPIVMFVDGICASGAYWAGAHCTEIVAGGRVTEIGSNGVVLQLDKEWIEYMRENHVGIYADGSELKHETFKDILDGNFDAIKTRELNPIRAEFVKVIKSGRPNVSEDAFSGAMFLAPVAKKMGLIDSIGNREFAVSRVISLAKKRTRSERAKKALSYAN